MVNAPSLEHAFCVGRGEEEEELEACPFCKHEAPRLYHINSMSPTNQQWCVLCDVCRMRGPTEKTKEEARRLWNNCLR